MFYQTIIDIISQKNTALWTGPVRAALSILEIPYRAIVTLRNKLFDRGIKKTHTLPAATISIGNITTGGTGKTPMVIEITLRLIALDAKPAILLRGYKSKNNQSDEAMVLAKELGSTVPVIANPSRVLGARAAMDMAPDTDVFILDDGFQHRQAGRDLDLLLVDATQPFGYQHVLPRGLLREPLSNLKRAGAIIITRCEQASPTQIQKLDQAITQITGRPPLAHAQHKWIGFTRNRTNDNQAKTILQDLNVIGVSGIANPAPFFNTLSKMTNKILHTHIMPDHYHYSRAWLDNLLKQAIDANAHAIVTTEKDWVKWLKILEAHPEIKLPLPIYRPLLRMAFIDGGHIIDALLAKTLTAHAWGIKPRKKKNAVQVKHTKVTK